MVVWRLTDRKPGHETQTSGLLAALQRRVQLEYHDIVIDRTTTGLADLLLRRFPPGNQLPSPDLLLGAGHATHLPLLAARRAYGGRAVVLMRPSLPLVLFDLCLIPEHDNPPRRHNVLITQGVLNGLTATGAHHRDRGLVLIGGPSRHHGWDQPGLLGSLRRLFESSPDMGFTLSDSRRTPDGFISALEAQGFPNCRIVPLAETGPGWVAEQLATSALAWVTEDSVSMVYEALTAGCRVGLLPLPLLRTGRVSRGVASLLESGWVNRFENGVEGAPPPSPKGFNEADRCAGYILDKGWRTN